MSGESECVSVDELSVSPELSSPVERSVLSPSSLPPLLLASPYLLLLVSLLPFTSSFSLLFFFDCDDDVVFE